MNNLDIIQPSKPIVFSAETGPLIVDMLKKYQLGETAEEFQKKMIAKQPLRSRIVLKITEAVIAGDIKKEDVSPRLQNEFGIEKQIADQLSADISNSLIPLGSINTETVAIETPLPIASEMQTPPAIAEKLPEKKIPEVIPEKKLPKKAAELPKSPGVKDSYREPIQ